jgi:hypothetical protein
MTELLEGTIEVRTNAAGRPVAIRNGQVWARVAEVVNTWRLASGIGSAAMTDPNTAPPWWPPVEGNRRPGKGRSLIWWRADPANSYTDL